MSKVQSSKKLQSNRLIEYFVTLSCCPPEEDFSLVKTPSTKDASKFHLKLTSRYPLEDHVDNALNEDSTILPFVSAMLASILKSNVSTSQSNIEIIPLEANLLMPKMHHFVCTGSKGQYLYGTCLILFETLEDKKTNIVPKCLILLSQHSYLFEFRDFLTNLYRVSTIESSIPIERYIANFVGEVPCPPPGQYRVQYTPYSFPAPLLFRTPSSNLSLVLSCTTIEKSVVLNLLKILSVDNILTIWQCLLVERQVLLVSSSVSLLTMISEAMLALLYPLEWTHVYIPLLPNIATTILNAPVPYFCGVHRDVLATALLDMSQETIIVDLDYNTMTFGPSTPTLAPLPYRYRVKLETLLNTVLTHINQNSEEEVLLPGGATGGGSKKKASSIFQQRISQYDEAFTPPPANTTIMMGKQTLAEYMVEGFLRFFISVLGHYRTYLIFPNKNTPAAMGFKTRGFILNQKFDYQPLLRQLCSTQLFDSFITKRLYNPSAADVTFFDKCIQMKWDFQSARRSARWSLRGTRPTCQSFIQVSDLESVKTVVALEPNADRLQGRTFTYSEFPNELDVELLGEIRFEEMMNNYSYMSPGSSDQVSTSTKATTKQFITSSSDITIDVATFALFFLAYCNCIGVDIVEQLKNSTGQGKNKQKANEVNAIEDSLAQLEMSVTRSNRSLHHQSSNKTETPPPQTSTAKKVISKEEQHLKEITQLHFAFDVLTYLRTNLSKKGDAVVYQCLMEACGKVGDTELGKEVVHCMHEDRLLDRSLDINMYTTLVRAYSVLGRPDSLAQSAGNNEMVDRASTLPQWANGTNAHEMDWNELRRRRLFGMRQSSRSLQTPSQSVSDEANKSPANTPNDSNINRGGIRGAIRRVRQSRVEGNKVVKSGSSLNNSSSGEEKKQEVSVPESVLAQISLGETLLESIYPDITIDTESETCPDCKRQLSEKEVVNGWQANEQDYTTTCFFCKRRFVPRFSVTSTSPSFVGSRGPTSPLYCEMLSPWVLQKELYKIMAEGNVSDILDPEWRDEAERATLWWNLVVSFKRYRLPITFLIQGDFSDRSLI